MSETKQHRLRIKFEHIFKTTNDPAFLKMESLGGEVPFFITTYAPEEQTEVDQEIVSLLRRFAAAGTICLEINLFDLCTDLLKARGIWDDILGQESKHNKSRFLRMMQPPLNPEKHIAPEIRKRLAQVSPQLVILTGVGLVFPFIRSHTILNNLQSVITEAPTIMFFPGNYDGSKLELFGRLKDDNYYRAFYLDEFKS